MTEAAGVAIVMDGPAVIRAAEALDAFDQFGGELRGDIESANLWIAE